MYYFLCSVCQKKLTVDEDEGGQLIRCGDCATILVASEEQTNPQGTLPKALEAPLHVKKSWSDESEDMDMTPMVDVTFLLLIFFMITASYSLRKTFDLPRSEDSSAARSSQSVRELESDTAVVLVRIDQYNTFFVSSAAVGDEHEQEVTDRQGLLVELRRIRESVSEEERPNRLVVVAHGSARHEQVILAMDAGAAVGMQDVMLVTSEDEDD